MMRVSTALRLSRNYIAVFVRHPKASSFRPLTPAFRAFHAARPAGDARADELDRIAELAEEFGFGRVVVTHRQNLVLPDVKSADLHKLWTALDELGLGLPNYNHATDISACPGLDFCNLANARSIPIAEGLTKRLDDVDYLHDVGEVTLNISGCINACGHHHVGNIGILGIDKHGVEHYQIMLGGSSAQDASLGKILGPALVPEDLYDAVDTILHTYLDIRESPEEAFLACVRRAGTRPFKERVYA